MSQSKLTNLSHAQTVVQCNVCEDGVPGQYYCIQCKQTLCCQCEKWHTKVAASKDHNVVLRSQLGIIDTTTLKCADHGDQVSFHCEKCKISVCVKCVTGNHQGHKMVDLDKIFQVHKKALQNEIFMIQLEVLPRLARKKDEIKSEQEKYEKRIQQITKDMEAEHEELNRIHDERMESLSIIQRSHISTFNRCSKEVKTKMDLCEKRISEYQDAIRNNSLTAVFKFSERKEPLTETESNTKIPEPPSFVPGSIPKAVEKLGRLETASLSYVASPMKLVPFTITSRFKSPVSGYPRICITKEAEVWLGGNESRELVMVDFKGRVLRNNKIKNRPIALAGMDSGDIIVSPHPKDSNSVSRLLVDGSEQHVFDTSPSNSNGVSVTAEQKILICTLDGKVLGIEGNGSNVEQLYKGSGLGSAIHAVEDADGNIYISDCSNPAITMVSKDGNVLSTIKHTTRGQKLAWPVGLAIDNMGNILCTDGGNDCVYIIDRKQQMRELMGRSHGIREPLWLAVDKDNNIWITQKDGTVVVSKYLT